jgi:sugar phosphate isomerase/epimerase
VRLRHRDGTVVHLAYCTNVHPAEDVDGVLEQLRRYGVGVRESLGVERLGLGLWLAAPVADRLATSPGEVERLRAALSEHRIEVVTLNGFPYTGFHAPVVKKDVYRPDWTDPARLDYTLNCAAVLARLLPDDAARGSVSTLPLGWRTPWYADRQRQARENLDRLAEGLEKLAVETGRQVRVGLEPEPGCVVETTADAQERLSGLDTRHLGICLDTCHLAVGFEEPTDALARLEAVGLPVVKVQASVAVEAPNLSDPEVRTTLGAFAEDRFLHQTRESSGGRVFARDDLPDALDGRRPLSGRGTCRVHFHVPVHAGPRPPLRSTQDHLRRSLHALFGGPRALTDHVEVETYTWSVLPESQRPDGEAGLVAGLAGELAWTRDELTELKLEALF